MPWKKDILLRCDCVGIPEPQVFWKFNGKNYADSTFTNTVSLYWQFFSNAYKELYFCSFSTDFLFLRLFFQFFLKFCHISFIFSIPHFSKLVFPINFLKEQVKQGSGVETLKLTQINSDQSGNYTCTASNSIGSESIYYLVKVQVPPQSPLISIIETFYDSLRLSWSTTDNGGSPIKGTFTFSLSLYYIPIRSRLSPHSLDKLKIKNNTLTTN